MTVFLQQNKGKKKKKGVVPGGGLKAQMRDDLDYAEFDGGYAQDYEDFMWHWLHRNCPFPISTLRNAAVPSHAVQCHPGKSELCVAPFILLQWPEGLHQGASSFTISYVHTYGIAFSLSRSASTHTHNHVFVGWPSFSGEYIVTAVVFEFCGAHFY